MASTMALPRICMRAGARADIVGELVRIGVSRPWVITDAGIERAGIVARVRDALAQMPHAVFADVRENPTVAGVDAATAAFRDSACDGIVALGGGSVLDTAKGVAIVATLGGGMADYLGRNAMLTDRLIPLLAVPTTAGSGSEASPATGIHPDEHRRAVGTRSLVLVPLTVVADAELTVGLPPALTAATGLDALSHAMEGFLAEVHAPILDAMALSGISRVAQWLERAVNDGADLTAREQMLCASLEGGAVISKGLGPAHALANTLGDRGLHHGGVVAAILPHVLRRWERLRPDRMALVAQALGLPSARPSDWVEALMERIAISPTVPAGCFVHTTIDEIADDAARSPFNRTCAVPPTADEYRAWAASVLA